MKKVPKDLGQRIVEASRLAVLLHVQSKVWPGGCFGGAGVDVHNAKAGGAGQTPPVPEGEPRDDAGAEESEAA